MSAEHWVTEHLTQCGWRIRARNWRSRRGEIDIVADRNGQLRFVEVKARRTLEAGLRSIGQRKRRALINAAETYVARHYIDCDEMGFMLAVVTIRMGKPVITLFDHPFDGS